MAGWARCVPGGYYPPLHETHITAGAAISRLDGFGGNCFRAKNLIRFAALSTFPKGEG